MYGADVLLLASTAAALFWTIVSTSFQKNWRVYDLFIGKKHGFKVHFLLMVLVAAQLVAMTVLDVNSRWLFPTFWPVGIVVCGYAVWIFVQALREGGFGGLTHRHLFRHTLKMDKRGAFYRRFKQPFIASYTLFYVGLGLATGHIAYIIVSFLLLAGLSLVEYLIAD